MPFKPRYGITHPDGRRSPAWFLTREAAQREADGRDGAEVYEAEKWVDGRPSWSYP